MDSNTKLILDELDRKFREHDDKWESRFASLENRSDPRVDTLEAVVGELESWKQEMEGVVDDVRFNVKRLNDQLDRIVIDRAATNSVLLSVPPPPSQMAAARSSAGLTAESPHGHCVDSTPRDIGFGSITTQRRVNLPVILGGEPAHRSQHRGAVVPT